MLLTGDLGFSVVERFADAFPERFYNLGVAEQNLIGVATGLALAEYIPFTYSIATFASMRAYEFIRNGPIAHSLPVRLIGVGGGFEYGTAGSTHHAIEDIALMRAQRNICVIAPADSQQAVSALRSTWNLPSPIYYRIGKDEDRIVEGLGGRFELGRAHIIREGNDVALLAVGPLSANVVAAAELLEEEGINASVMVVSSIVPAPESDILELLAAHRLVVTIEAHAVTGGLGSLVAELIAEFSVDSRLVRCGVRRDAPLNGSERFLLDWHGLSAAGIAKSVALALKE
jgi:transketolase